MAQAGFTPIQLYFSTTASATPSAGNLANGELAINITDGRLFYKDNGGTVRVLAGTGGSGVVAGSNTQVQFNNNGVFGASANMTFNGTRLTVADLADASLTAGRVTYATTGGNLTDSANLTFDGTNLTLGGGTANGVAYLNGSKVLTTGSALTFDGSSFVGTGKFQSQVLRVKDASYSEIYFSTADTGGNGAISYNHSLNAMAFYANGSEQMRLTSTGLGIGTSSPSTYSAKLAVVGTSYFAGGASSTEQARFGYTDGTSYWGMGRDNVTTGNFILNNAGTTVATFSTSGNFGLGMTPSAWTIGKVMQFGNGASILSYANIAYHNANAYFDGSWRYVANAAAGRVEISDSHKWFTAPSGTAGNAISFTQAMTLAANGNLSIGPATASVYQKILASGAAGSGSGEVDIALYDSTANRYFQMVCTGGSYNYVGIGSSESALYSQSTLTLAVDNNISPSGVIKFATGGSERARIDSSGNFRVGFGTSTPNLYMDVNHVTGSITGSSFFVARYNGTQIGDIAQNGTTGVSYNTSSDYRLKENIQPMTGALAKVAQLKPCTYKWKADGSAGEGFIAHELAEVVPACVTGEKDAVDADGNPVYQGIDTSFLTATLTAAIQEQQTIINQLKARLDAANL